MLGVIKQVDEVLLERRSLLLQPVIEVGGVEVLEPLAQVAEFVRELGSERFLRKLIEHPDLLVLLLGQALQTSVLERNVVKVRLVHFNRDRIAFVVKFRLDRHLGDLQSDDAGDRVVDIFGHARLFLLRLLLFGLLILLT